MGLESGISEIAIRDPEKTYPGSRVKKASDPGSATLLVMGGGKGLPYLWQRSHRLAPQFLHPLQPHLGIAQRLCRAPVVHVEHVVGQTDDLVAKLLVQRERFASKLADWAGAAEVVSHLHKLFSTIKTV
jgi:hypothetical protein